MMLNAAPCTDEKLNLLGLDAEALRHFLEALGEKPYRAQQILKWIHYYGCSDFNAMTDLSKNLRQTLQAQANLTLPQVIHEQAACDGTYKWLLRLADGNCIETVFIPDKTRGTLCISSQVGCILNCDFCSTGKQGFSRNLTSAEIISQLWIATRKLSQQNGEHDRRITNVVMMGMGEPLLNLQHVLPALKIMLDDFAYNLSKRRVTVSTAGVIPAMYLLRKSIDVALAVSLHAPNDELRNKLVPLNKKYPLKELIQACKAYFMHDKKRSITIEYVMLHNVNDTFMHAKQLVKLLNGLRVKVNLIPFNAFPFTDYKCSDKQQIISFQNILLQAGLHTTIRRTRGEEIDAACGQLVGKVNDRTHRRARYLNKLNKKQKVIGEN